jgi:hypothetical protein
MPADGSDALLSQTFGGCSTISCTTSQPAGERPDAEAAISEEKAATEPALAVESESGSAAALPPAARAVQRVGILARLRALTAGTVMS